MTQPSAGGALPALHYDGREAHGRAVQVRVMGDELVAEAEDGAVASRWTLGRVRWPERTRHGRRVAHLPGGGHLRFDDAAAYDAWIAAQGHRESWVVRAQQDWRAVAGVTALLLLFALFAWQIGIPWAARGTVALLPDSADQLVGQVALQAFEGRWLQPSQIPHERQQRLRAALRAAVEQRYAPAERQPVDVRFFKAVDVLGPNAFALPGGCIVVTDALVNLLSDREEVLLGVLGHEYGHLRHRHGMRTLVQSTLISALTSVALGDFSTLLAGAPALLAEMAYSRDFEREADAEAVVILRTAGQSPEAMVQLFERLHDWRPTGAAKHANADDDRDADDVRDQLPIALASHPMDAERMAFFRSAAAR